MQFIQNPKDGSCKLKFSWKERWLLFRRGHLFMDQITFRHFSNNLMKMIADWNRNFNEETKKISTKKDDSVQGK
tara:strand:+ start:2186 stop:2407 length:222 start_codon:yes stop_codon:yes gene_type:complete